MHRYGIGYSSILPSVSLLKIACCTVVRPCTTVQRRDLCIAKISLLVITPDIHGRIDTLRIFSSGTDAARINQQRCFACAKLAIKSVHGCTLLMIDVPFICKRKVDSAELTNILNYYKLHGNIECNRR